MIKIWRLGSCQLTLWTSSTHNLTANSLVPHPHRIDSTSPKKQTRIENYPQMSSAEPSNVPEKCKDGISIEENVS